MGSVLYLSCAPVHLVGLSVCGVDVARTGFRPVDVVSQSYAGESACRLESGRANSSWSDGGNGVEEIKTPL